MGDPTGEASTGALRLDFDWRLLLQFRGSAITSDAGLLAYRELDDTLCLTDAAAGRLADGRSGKNGRHRLAGLLRQAVFGRLAGYEDVNDAERLCRDPAMRWVVGDRAVAGFAASASQMGRFETKWLCRSENLATLADLPGQWIDKVHERRPSKRIVLDMDSSESPTYGQQEDSAYNGHFGCTCYHPLFVFNQLGDVERCALRSGNVHSADGWRAVLEPVVARYRGTVKRLYFRGDAAFANPEIYAFLEAEGAGYTIRLPGNRVLQDKIGYLLKRPIGRPPAEVRRFFASFGYQAQSWNKPRRVVAKVEWHPGELYPRVGFIVTNLARPAERVVAFYNQRGTAEQCWCGRPPRHRLCQNEVVADLRRWGPSVEQISRIGMDTSKHFFQLHGVNAADQPVLRKKLRRKEMVAFFENLSPTVIAIEACGTSHYWARLLRSFGHEVKLIAPQLVKPYVKRGKNDAADAEALCEAMSRPTMRFVPVKTAEQQAALMMVGLRDRLIRNCTQLSNAIRSYAAEFGFTAAKGKAHLVPLLERIHADESVPILARGLFAAQAEEYARLQGQIDKVDAELMAWHKADECSRRLAKIPSVGPIGAALLMMKTPAPEMFRSGRQFAAWIGLTPKDHSTAGKVRPGVITRAGDETLRSVLVVGATSVIQHIRRGGRGAPWIVDLLNRKPPKLAAVALANKVARVAWKLMVSGQCYSAKSAPTALARAA